MSDGTEVVFVTGAVKTASSSLVGVLNTHPDVFLLYEAAMFADPPTRRARDFLAAFPDARPMFRPDGDVVDRYDELARWLTARGHRYRIVGDKVLTTSGEMLRRLGARRVIYCTRDVRTWLVKRQVRQSYVVDDNLIPAAVLFCAQLLESFKLPQRMHVKAKDFVEDNDAVTRRLGTFLDIDLTAHAERWWERLDSHPSGDPKAAIGWWTQHDSSAVQPRRIDVEVELRPHAFWDDLLPVFDRYFGALDTVVDDEQVDQDLAFVRSLLDRPPLPLRDAYSRVEQEVMAGGARRVLLGRAKHVISRATGVGRGGA